MYSKKLTETLQKGGVAVMKTDTIYGIVGRADTEATVARIYAVKQRTPSKSPIILIGDISQLFDSYPPEILSLLDSYWPGPNSIILPSTKAPTWIRRDNDSVAYRLPANKELRELLLQTGPLIAPSANPEGLPPAMTIHEASSYFAEAVDHYEDGGLCANSAPSSLLKVDGEQVTKLR